MKTTKLERGRPECPSCSTKLDGATSVEDHTPKGGDYSVCLECGEILRFGPGALTLESAEINDDELSVENARLLREMSAHIKQRGRR